MSNTSALPIRRRLMSAIFGLLALGPTCRAAIIQSTWQGVQNDEWSNPANWLPADSYPQNGADSYQVGIADASIRLSENITIDSLTLNGGDLNGAFTLSVVSSGGLSFAGLNSLTSGLTLDIAGPIAFADDSAALTNHGTVVFKVSGAGNYSASNATLTNASTGTLRFDPANGIAIGDPEVSPFRLINEGVFFADNGSFNYVHAPVTNSGVIRATAQSGLFFTTSSNFGGSFVADPLSTISLGGYNDQTHTLTQLDISGDGYVQTYSTNLTGSLKSGTLTSNFTTFTGSFTVEADATLEWAAQNAFSADSDSLTNHGVVLFSSSDNDFPTASSASFVNATGGTITFDANGYIGDSNTSPFSLINQGTLLADNGSFNYVHAPVTNSGVIRATAQSGLFFTTSSNFGGSFVADPLSTISLGGYNDQTHTLTQLDISGDGYVQTYSTNLTGSLKSGTLTSNFTTFTGSFTVEADATLEWAAQNAFSADSDSLTNHGVVLFSSSDNDFPTASSASFVNATGGTITFDANGHIGDSNTSPFALTNHGALITGDATFNSLHVPVTNFGAIHVTTGATLTIGTTFTQNAGETRVTNATLNALPDQTLYFNGGTLRGAGGIYASLQLAHTGVEIGDEQTAGSLVVTGDLALQEGSSLRLDLNGTTQGTAYDHLAVNGTVTLGGDLVIRVSPSFLSSIQSTDTFAVLGATDITGSFTNVVNGERANLPSGLGDCIVTITGTQVLLSDFVGSTLNAFLAAAGVPADRRDHDDDYDSDGHSNLLEYALDLDPLSRDAAGLPVVANSGDTLTLTYRRARNDVVYEVLTTTTLSDPESWTTTGVTQGLPDINGMITASVPLPATAAFLRLRVNYAP